MSAARQDFTKFGFAKTYVLPALLVFLIPGFSFFFFRHAERHFDGEARASFLRQVRSDRTLSDADRAAVTAFVTGTPLSKLAADGRFDHFVGQSARFHYSVFRWMIRLATIWIVVSLAVSVLAAFCVLVSARSQRAQALSLQVGWHALRIYAALQTMISGILLVALSFWVPALWFNSYSVKLIFAVGALAVLGMAATILAIFRHPKFENAIEGTVLSRDANGELWSELNKICTKVGSAPPDQLVVGIDDNFFVTEAPVTVGGTQYTGKTLFVSLAMLRYLDTEQAEAVLAHEMAHFSGNDTYYSQKTAPVLRRYEAYLQMLRCNAVAMPAFYVMLCFRGLFELSLRKLQREREFRADKVAASVTSPAAVGAALLRTAGYSRFRRLIEGQLFKLDHKLDAVNISERIDRGLAAFIAEQAASEQGLRMAETVHPFDTHPPLSQRLEALDVALDANVRRSLPSTADRSWYTIIPESDALERREWARLRATLSRDARGVACFSVFAPPR